MVILAFILGFIIAGMIYGRPRDESLLAIYEEGEAWMTIVKTIQRYETKIMHRLPQSLRQDPVLTEKNLLKPLEERIQQRMALIESVLKQLKEQ